jgi:hypothetical protein
MSIKVVMNLVSGQDRAMHVPQGTGSCAHATLQWLPFTRRMSQEGVRALHRGGGHGGVILA